jgi:hypothetical protein
VRLEAVQIAEADPGERVARIGILSVVVGEKLGQVRAEPAHGQLLRQPQAGRRLVRKIGVGSLNIFPLKRAVPRAFIGKQESKRRRSGSVRRGLTVGQHLLQEDAVVNRIGVERDTERQCHRGHQAETRCQGQAALGCQPLRGDHQDGR